MKKARRVAVGALIVGLTASCILRRGEPSVATDGPAVVRVENGDQHDLSVFFVQAGQRTRLGTVVALSTSAFEVPERLIRAASEAQLFGDPVGVRAQVMSERFVLKPGQQVVWTIDAGLRRSSLGIF